MVTTEKIFANKMEIEGWELHKNGFPDFICTKGKDIIFVEVKRHKKDYLREHQYATLTLLQNMANVGTFVWSPDISDMIPIYKYDGKIIHRVIKKRMKGTPKDPDRDNKLRKYHKEHPELSYLEVARHYGLKLSRQRMSQILNDGKGE